jgi:glutathione S-transferase
MTHRLDGLHTTGLYPDDPVQLALAWQWLEFGETTLAPATNPGNKTVFLT